MALLAVVLLSCLVGVTVGYSSYDLPSSAADFGAYDDALMQDLYKRLASIDPSYFLQREEDEFAPPPMDDREMYERPPPGDWIDDDDSSSQLKSRPRSPVAGGQTDTRDQEYIGHSSNAGSDGFIYMSGIAYTGEVSWRVRGGGVPNLPLAVFYFPAL